MQASRTANRPEPYPMNSGHAGLWAITRWVLSDAMQGANQLPATTNKPPRRGGVYRKGCTPASPCAVRPAWADHVSAWQVKPLGRCYCTTHTLFSQTPNLPRQPAPTHNEAASYMLQSTQTLTAQLQPTTPRARARLRPRAHVRPQHVAILYADTSRPTRAIDKTWRGEAHCLDTPEPRSRATLPITCVHKERGNIMS